MRKKQINKVFGRMRCIFYIIYLILCRRDTMNINHVFQWRGFYEVYVQNLTNKKRKLNINVLIKLH